MLISGHSMQLDGGVVWRGADGIADLVIEKLHVRGRIYAGWTT
jgi:hypothetical protein